MKKLFLSVIIAASLFSCATDNRSPEQVRANEENFERWHGFKVKVVDSCEYIIRADRNSSGHAGWGFGFMAHKGNCRFCTERRKKEVTEIIDSLFMMQD